MARPQIDLEDVLTKIEVYLEVGCSLYESCLRAGLSYTSVYRHFKNGERVLERLESEDEEEAVGAKCKATSTELAIEVTNEADMAFVMEVDRLQNQASFVARRVAAFPFLNAKAKIEQAEGRAKKANVAFDITKVDLEPDEWKAAQWWLERKNKDEFSRREERSLEGGLTVQFSENDVDDEGKPITGA